MTADVSHLFQMFKLIFRSEMLLFFSHFSLIVVVNLV